MLQTLPGSCLSVDQMLLIWTVARIVLIRKKYFKIDLKQKLVREEKDSCLLILYSLFIKPLSLILKRNLLNGCAMSHPLLIHLQFILRKTIFYSVSVPYKTTPNRFSDASKSNYISFVVNMLWTFRKRSMENFLGGSGYCGLDWGWFVVFLITKLKQNKL